MVPTKKNRALMVVIYCIYLLVFFEVVSRLFFLNESLMSRLFDCYDTWHKIQWVNRVRVSKRINLPYDSYHMHHPVRGWTLKPNIKDMVINDGKFLNTNSRHIRDKSEYSFGKPNDKTRILVLGDSYTFGEEVDDEETYVFYLSRILPNSEVINFGVSGYGHDQMLIYLKEEGIKYQPDIVMLGYIDGDRVRNTLKFRDYLKPKFELVGNKLKLTNTPIPSPDVVFRREIFRPRFFDLLAILFEKYTRRTATADTQTAITKAILDEMIKTIDGIGALPIFVYLPSNYDEIKRLTDKGQSPEEKFFFEYCGEKNVCCLSTCPDFLFHKKDGVKFKTYGHWSATGHKIVAQAISGWLFKNNIWSKEGGNLN